MAYFISIEGPDGSGKSTVIKRLETLMAKYYPQYHVVVTREPGGNPIAESIRDIILDPKNKKMGARCEALLYAASRAQHVLEKIEPIISKPQTLILCDRFIDSSLVYQGIGRGLGVEQVLAINLFATDDILPFKTLFLDIEPKMGLNRINADKDREYNRLDMEKLSFHQDVYAGYLKLIKQEPDRFIVVDASQDLEAVCQDAWQCITQVIDNEA